MSGRRSARQNSDEPEVLMIEGQQYEDVTDEADEIERLENDIKAELGSSKDIRIKIKVHRKPLTGSLYPLLFEVPGESVEGVIEQVRSQYGTGTYEARVWKDFGDGKGFKQRERIPFAIELPKNPVVQTQPDHSGSALVASVQQTGQILQTVVQQLAELKAAPPQAPAQFDPVKMMESMGAMMVALKQFMPEPPKPAEPPLKLITEIFSFARELQDEGREKGMIDIVGDFLKSPLLEQVITSAQQNPKPAPISVPPGTIVPRVTHQPAKPPQVNKPPQQPSQQQTTQETQVDITQQFHSNLAYMITRAQKGSEPGLYAEWLIDNLDDGILNAILSVPNPVDVLTQYNTQVSIYREWFATLVEEMREQLTGGEDGLEQESAQDHVADGSVAARHSASPIPADGPTGGTGGGASDFEADEPSY